jgi:type I restriction enzyme S subunit
MGWAKVKLGEIANIGAGNSAPQDKALFDGGTHKFFRTSDVGKVLFGTLLEAKDSLNENGIKKLKKYKAGDILLPKSGASTFLNHRVLLGVDGYVSSHLAVISAKDSIVLSSYLLYFLSTIKAQDLIQGHDYPSLKLSDIKNIDIDIPSIPEQKRIVAILDQAFASIEQARAKTEQNLKNARELFESYLQQVFSQRGEGWVEKGLKDVSLDFGRGKSKHRPRNDDSLYGGDYPFIQTGDVRNCEHVIEKYSKTYNEKGLAQSKLWPKGTICITIAANIAETGILDFESCFPDSVVGVVIDPKITTIRYVEYLLQSFKTILKTKGQGAAQDNINMGTFKNMQFPFPCVEEQTEIVRSLDNLMTSVQQLERIYADKRITLDELKKSILQKAFCGELTNTERKGVAV